MSGVESYFPFLNGVRPPRSGDCGNRDNGTPFRTFHAWNGYVGVEFSEESGKSTSSAYVNSITSMGKKLSPQSQRLAASTPTPGDRYGRGIPMSQNRTAKLLFSFLALATLSGTGCVGITAGPNFGLIGVPIPVSPYFQKIEEDEFWNKERYEKVPILGPLTAGGPAVALDPPSEDEVMRAFEKARAHPRRPPLLA
jgi:hypothetical protein